jgi:hypothetical protein
MTTTTKTRPSPVALLLFLAAMALVAYYFWPRNETPVADPSLAGDAAADAAPVSAASRSASNGPLPPGAVSNVGGIPLDANGNRILNEAGLPITNEPVPQAKPIPVKAPAGAVIGYTKDAAGNSQPIRAGDLKQIPNSPGTFAVVDMWADGGPTVVPPTQGQRLTPAEVAKLRAEEEARERAGRPQP